jgi:hypothetical protein
MESTRSFLSDRNYPPDPRLVASYRSILDGTDSTWAARCRDVRLVGRGGQVVVFLVE